MIKKLSLIISPLVVLLLMGTIFYIYGLYPLGEKTLSWCDMNQQVIPLLLDFKDILANKSDMFLNTQNAGGMSLWGVFLFFISSPFSFLVSFVKKQDMAVFMNIVVLIKMMVSSFTASLFFLKFFKNFNTALVAAFSVMYAFCGYSMLFYQNMVWLDMMYMFPILLICFYSLVEEQKILPYILTFSFIITINFYLSYMVILFLIIFMGLYIFICCNKENRSKTISIFCASSLMSAIITSVVWLPSFFQYLNSARSDGIIESLSQGSFFSPIYTTSIIIICTSIIVSSILFCFNKQCLGNKDFNLIFLMLILMVLPIIIDPINKMWHTGSYQAFPARYGYIYVFIGLIFSSIVISNIEKSKNHHYIKTSPLFFGFVSLSIIVFYLVSILLLINKKDELGYYTRSLWVNQTSFLALSIAFVFAFVCYFFSILVYKYNFISKNAFTLLICLVVVGESLFCGSTFIGLASRSDYSYRQVVDLSGKIEDKGFYRVKQESESFDVNMLGGIGYNNLGHYTSLTSKDYMFALKKLGYSSYWMEVSSVGGSMFTDALLSNKYTIKKSYHVKDDERTIYNGGVFSITKNEAFIPLGIKTKTDLSKSQALLDSSRIDVQEALFNNIVDNNKKLFKSYSPSSLNNVMYNKYDGLHDLKTTLGEDEHALNYKIHVGNKSTLYFDCFMDISNKLEEKVNDSFKITVNDIVTESKYPSKKNNGLLKLGTFENQDVNIKIVLRKNVICKSFGVYQIEHSNLYSALNSVSKVNLSINRNKIKGNCRSNGEEFLHIAIPYDKGYTAKINGGHTEIYKVHDSFMALKLNKGYNEIELLHSPVGFYQGLTLSVFGVLFLIAFLYFFKKGSFINNRILENALYFIFIGVFVLTILAIYVLPIAIHFIF